MYTSDKDDKELLSRADDAVSLASIRHKPVFIGFLNEREQYIIKEHLSYCADKLSFFGGYEDAARTVMCACDYEITPDDFPLIPVFFRFRKTDKLSHRDFLGSLMGLGIERDRVGDIIVNEGKAVCFVREEIADYIKSQLLKIGRVGVTIVDELDIDYSQNTEILTFIVSSLRLDVVVAAITGLSREKTSAFILSGKTFVNYNEVKNISRALKEGDILSIRGSGKYIIKEQTGLTKKGRIKINIEHYR